MTCPYCSSLNTEFKGTENSQETWRCLKCFLEFWKPLGHSGY